MELREAIEHARTVAEGCPAGDRDCAYQNDKLADWLEELEKLREILTAKGRSYSDPIYNEDGTINMDASRRVEFKFRMKDSEMIDEIRNILGSGVNQ